MRAGVLTWNKAFNKIGFDHAIVVEQQPEGARSLARVDLQAILASSEKALERLGLDAYTQAHLYETQARPQATLVPGLNLQQF